MDATAQAMSVIRFCSHLRGGKGKTELKKMGWRGNELDLRRKGEAGKVRLAQHLRENTTMSLAWIEERLQIGIRNLAYSFIVLAGGKKSLVRAANTKISNTKVRPLNDP
jgi:hypothetical protein